MCAMIACFANAYLTDNDTQDASIRIFSRVICACFFSRPKVFDLVLLIHKSVSVSFPLPFPGRLWFIDRKCIHIKMLLLTNLLCCKLISFMSFCLYACMHVILSWLFFFHSFFQLVRFALVWFCLRLVCTNFVMCIVSRLGLSHHLCHMLRYLNDL